VYFGGKKLGDLVRFALWKRGFGWGRQQLRQTAKAKNTGRSLLSHNSVFLKAPKNGFETVPAGEGGGETIGTLVEHQCNEKPKMVRHSENMTSRGRKKKE